VFVKLSREKLLFTVGSGLAIVVGQDLKLVFGGTGSLMDSGTFVIFAYNRCLLIGVGGAAVEKRDCFGRYRRTGGRGCLGGCL